VIEQVWWYVARATGIVAWALLTMAVVWGLLLSTSLLKSWSRPKWLLDLHRFLGGLAVLFTAFHLGALVADSYTSIGLTDLVVPLASSWKPWPVAGGVVALYLLVAVEVTSLAMRRLPRRYWRWVHLTSFGCFWLATVHGITAGSDAANRLLWWTSWGSSALVLFLTLYRVLADAEARRPARRRAQPGLNRPLATSAPTADPTTLMADRAESGAMANT
jgi:methionine sulfoxide reductase heme-binding subunit